MLNLLMQPREHIHAHGHPGDEGALQFFGRGLAILCGLCDRGEQRGLDEPEIDIGNPLGHANVRVVRRTRMRRRLAGLQTDIQRDGLVFGVTHMSWFLVWFMLTWAYKWTPWVNNLRCQQTLEIIARMMFCVGRCGENSGEPQLLFACQC